MVDPARFPSANPIHDDGSATPLAPPGSMGSPGDGASRRTIPPPYSGPRPKGIDTLPPRNNRKKPSRTTPKRTKSRTPNLFAAALLLVSLLTIITMFVNLRNVREQRADLTRIATTRSAQAILAQRVTDAAAGMDAFAARSLALQTPLYTDTFTARQKSLPTLASDLLSDKTIDPSFQERRAKLLDRLRKSSENAGKTNSSTQRKLILMLQLGTADYLSQLEIANSFREAGNRDAETRSYAQASDLIDQSLLPTADQFEKDANTQWRTLQARSDSAARSHLGVISALSVLLLLALLAAQALVFIRTKRILNAPLLVATLLILALSGFTILRVNASRSSLSSANESFDRVNRLRQIRSLSYVANANESRFYALSRSEYRNAFDATITKIVGNATERATLLSSFESKSETVGGLLGGFAGDRWVKTSSDTPAIIESVNQLLRYVNFAQESMGSIANADSLRTRIVNEDRVFAAFQKANQEAIDINKKKFDAEMKASLDATSPMRSVSWFSLLACLTLLFAGLLPRIREYRGPIGSSRISATLAKYSQRAMLRQHT
jgi:hypothetical protein